jgi:hypothetical protein
MLKNWSLNVGNMEISKKKHTIYNLFFKKEAHENTLTKVCRCIEPYCLWCGMKILRLKYMLKFKITANFLNLFHKIICFNT